jgi:hypothetical protein
MYRHLCDEPKTEHLFSLLHSVMYDFELEHLAQRLPSGTIRLKVLFADSGFACLALGKKVLSEGY